MSTTYEICGALPVLDHFRPSHAQQFVDRIGFAARVYFATDAVTHTLMLRISGALTDAEMKSIETALTGFSQKWARGGAFFRRTRYGESTFVPIGIALHVGSSCPTSDSVWN
ncbi:hypothetical protein [Burkholderia sp. MSMB1072]|uniref:hypothetical protein n=1 Tax=Burkholderia sp. MSMB1072 TaxID=1637871 RepID=UPI0015CFB0FC|nr:hypothetical protein [Burkholderia sp. MSMB1072]